jgi:hypothetical protein
VTLKKFLVDRSYQIVVEASNADVAYLIAQFAPAVDARLKSTERVGIDVNEADPPAGTMRVDVPFTTEVVGEVNEAMGQVMRGEGTVPLQFERGQMNAELALIEVAQEVAEQRTKTEAEREMNSRIARWSEMARAKARREQGG